jgi:hypothetical protein
VKIDTKELSAGCLNDIPCDFDGNAIQILLGDLVAGPSTVLGAA